MACLHRHNYLNSDTAADAINDTDYAADAAAQDALEAAVATCPDLDSIDETPITILLPFNVPWTSSSDVTSTMLSATDLYFNGWLLQASCQSTSSPSWKPEVSFPMPSSSAPEAFSSESSCV